VASDDDRNLPEYQWVYRAEAIAANGLSNKSLADRVVVSSEELGKAQKRLANAAEIMKKANMLNMARTQLHNEKLNKNTQKVVTKVNKKLARINLLERQKADREALRNQQSNIAPCIGGPTGDEERDEGEDLSLTAVADEQDRIKYAKQDYAKEDDDELNEVTDRMSGIDVCDGVKPRGKPCGVSEKLRNMKREMLKKEMPESADVDMLLD